MLTRHSAFVTDPGNLGYQERLRQIEVIRSGAKCYVVMREPVEARLPERVIKAFNSDEVFRTGSVVDFDGDIWLELLERVRAQSVRDGALRKG